MSGVIRRRVTRERGGEFCRLEVELREREPGKLELSICGTAGYIMKRAQAVRENLEGLASYFDEPGALASFNAHNGTRFRSPMRAAKYAASVDGDLNGDQEEQEDGRVFCTSSCGQIREELAAFFPEAVPYFHWHLNAMRASADGKAWGYEELPAHVVAWVEGLPGSLTRSPVEQVAAEVVAGKEVG